MNTDAVNMASEGRLCHGLELAGRLGVFCHWPAAGNDTRMYSGGSSVKARTTHFLWVIED